MTILEVVFGRKKNCWTQKVNLAVTISKILLDVLLDMYILGRVLLKGAGPEYEFENQSPTIYNWNAWRIVNVVEGEQSEQKVDEFYPQLIEELSSIRWRIRHWDVWYLFKGSSRRWSEFLVQIAW